MTIIAQGAEAIIQQKGEKVIKERVKKGYRIPEIDEKLRKYRTRNEAKIMAKLWGNINVPRILEVSEKEKKIELDFIDGKKLSEHFDALPNKESIAEEIGKQIAKMHDLDVIHGDLTTSNMILQNEKVYFIDFGLAFNSKRIEDKAVDLHLLKEALHAKHFLHAEKLYASVLKGYETSKNAHAVNRQLKKVEARGRYKSMI